MYINSHIYCTWQYPNIYIHELVVRAWQLASVSQLVRELHWNHRATCLIPARNLKLHFLLHLPISYRWQYPSIYTYELVDRARQMASVAKSIASESQACRFNSCQGRDLKLHFFLVTKVFRNKCTVYKFPLDNFHLQYPSNIIHYPHKSLYHKPPPISPGFIYFRKQFLMGLYKGRRGLIYKGGAYIQGWGLIYKGGLYMDNRLCL